MPKEKAKWDTWPKGWEGSKSTRFDTGSGISIDEIERQEKERLEMERKECVCGSHRGREKTRGQCGIV